jgi:hypothetical protein
MTRPRRGPPFGLVMTVYAVGIIVCGCSGGILSNLHDPRAFVAFIGFLVLAIGSFFALGMD